MVSTMLSHRFYAILAVVVGVAALLLGARLALRDARQDGAASPTPGCYYQQVQCIRAPCDPVLVCPTPSY